MKMHISNANNQVHELAPPTCVLLLSKNFDPSLFFNVAPPLCPCPCPTSTSLSQSLSKAFISLYNLSPFVINFHKRCASHWWKGLHWGRWLTLESCIFYEYHLIVGMTPCVGSCDLDTNCSGAPPPVSKNGSYHLIILSSCVWWNFLHLIIT